MVIMLKLMFLSLFCTLLHSTIFIYAAQINRKSKFIFDFIQPSSNVEISKDLASTKNINSPIYYIRMPPVPYTYIPGLGYVSNPQNGAQDLVNLPLPFLGNGKPVTIYRWSQIPLINTPTLQSGNENIKDSSVQRLEGKFVFNGKPKKEIFVLRDEFNSLYDEDVLNNIYP